MNSHRNKELVTAILRAFNRIDEALKDITDDREAVPGLLTYKQSIERAVILSPDLINKQFRFLLDLSRAFQHIYLDATYRSDLHFNASLDLSEIYSYSNPSPSRTWSKIVRFSIVHHNKNTTRYNVLPTTVLETLFFLRRFYRSCRHYGDYSSLGQFLSNPVIESTDGLEEHDELSIPMIGEFSDALPLASFLSMIQSSSAEASPQNPARALFDLVAEGDVRPIDEEIKEVLADKAIGMSHYRTQYDRVLGHLESRRPNRRFNNSIDARSYQLSLALNELVHSQQQYTYMPILSSGMPLNEFANIGWEMDPLRVNPRLEKDETLDLEDLKARRIFTTARSPHYHFLATLLQLQFPNDPGAVANSARKSLVEVKKAIDEWSKTIRRLHFRGTKPGPAGALRKLLLRIDRDVISDDTKQLLEIERSARSRIVDPEEFRDRLLRGNEWIERRFPNRETYDQVIIKNFDEVRNQVIRTFHFLEDTLQLLLDMEEREQGLMLPDLQDLVSWTAQLVKGKEK